MGVFSVEIQKMDESLITGFGETAVVFDGVGDNEITGVFDAPYSDDSDVSTEIPQFLCLDDTVVDIETGDRLEIRDTLYQVHRIVPDGTGLTTLFLRHV